MSIRAFLRRYRERPLGQSLTEFALILPVFLVIVSAAVDLGRIAYARVTIANVAREASFQAAQTPTSYQAGLPCTSGNEDQNLVICRGILESTGSVVTVTPADITVTCSPDCDGEMGNTVSVTARGRFNLLTPVMAVFFGGTTITFSSTATNQISAMPDLASGETDPPPIGGETTTVPSLFGLPEDQVEPLLTAASLTVGTRFESYSSTIPAGSVLSQNPSAGTTVAVGAVIDYMVSLGPESVPDCAAVSAGFDYTETDSTPATPDDHKSPVTVTVSDTTTYNTACVTVWAWDWGDGNITYGRIQAPHQYRNQTGPPGNVKSFTLTLTVTSGTFESTSGSVEILVMK